MGLFTRKPEKRGYFVHIPKTAGGSLRYFSRHAGFDIIGHNLRDPNYVFFCDYQDRHQLFSFTFVRDPLDRALSAFRFLCEGGINEADQLDAQEFIQPYEGDFNIFVQKELTKEKVLDQLHFMPQYRWICDSSENLCVDMICHYENLKNDLNKLLHLTNSSQTFELPVKNRSIESEIIIEARTKEIIHNVYQKDYSLFNYED